MLSALKGLLASKRFWMVVIGSGLVAGLNQLGVPQDIIVIVASFFGLNILTQGAADVGKEKAKIEAK